MYCLLLTETDEDFFAHGLRGENVCSQVVLETSRQTSPAALREQVCCIEPQTAGLPCGFIPDRALFLAVGGIGIGLVVRQGAACVWLHYREKTERGQERNNVAMGEFVTGLESCCS